MLSAYPGLEVRRLFSRPEEVLSQEKARIEAKSGREQADLNLFYRLILEPGADAEKLIDELNALPVVELAYPEPLPQPPPGSGTRLWSTTPDFEDQQGYLDAAPQGIDAEYAWSQPGGRGDRSKIVDVEYSWNQTHEDLSKAAAPGALIPNGTPVDPCDLDPNCPPERYRNHGTGVLGILVGDDNGFGVTGIAPDADIGMVNAFGPQGYILADAIDIAHANLDDGDVILIEQQWIELGGPDGCSDGVCGYVPVEIMLEFYAVIVSATSDGIIVVEAAGNGNENLDDAHSYGDPFPQGLSDSGAIMVGAGAAPGCTSPPRGRLHFSTYGSRVDLQGWGECMVSTGYGYLQGGTDPDLWYTDRFGGTSGASAMVAGAAALLSSVARGRDNITPTPTQVREILRATGTAQDTTSPGALAGHIGPLPDLLAALQVPLASFPTWAAEGNQAEAWFGYSVASAGDVNADGYVDVIVGAPGFSNGQASEGKAFVFSHLISTLTAIPVWTAEGNQIDSQFGASVASAGDVNGDGYSDVLTGAPRFSNGQADEGGAFLFLGSASGLGATPAWTAEGNRSDSWFGASVASAGDVNGDGYSDVIVGAPGFSYGQPGDGRAFVFLGSTSGLDTAPAWTRASSRVGAHFGHSVGTAGDVNGDGYGDVIVGAYAYGNGQSLEGAAFVFLGSASGLGTTPAWIAESDQAGAYFGQSVGTAGDVNGDGYSDVIVGAPGFYNGEADEGGAFLFLGSASGLAATPVWTAEGNRIDSRLGASVGPAGDVNEDGFSDVIVGAPGLLFTSTDEGRAFVFLGSALGLAATPVWTAEGSRINSQFGASVGTAGDANGDGLSDVVVGAPGFSNGVFDEGGGFAYLSVCASPAEVRGLGWLGDGVTLDWTPGVATTTSYDLMYGDLDDVSFLGTGAGDVCLADDYPSAQLADTSPDPSPGEGWFFLVRGNNACGGGRYETSSSGGDRQTTACP